MSDTPLSYREITYSGDGMFSVPSSLVADTTVVSYQSDDSTRLVPITQAHKIYPFDKRSEMPEWFSMLVEQAEFYTHNKNLPIMMKFPDEEVYFMVGKHVESFIDWLRTIHSDGVIFNRHLGGHIVIHPEWSLETNKAMSVAGIIVTPYASDFISPVTEQSLQLLEDAQRAEQDGFHEPRKELFPSDRTLMKHQLPVAQVLGWRGKGILADDVGSGKSSMFLNGFFIRVQHLIDEQYYDSLYDVPPLVIVTKKSLLENTQRECQVWLDGVKTQIVTGNKPKDIKEDTQIIIVPGTSLNKQLPSIIAAQPCGVVYDESHMYKNLNSNRGKAAAQLAQWVYNNNEYPYIVCASATPMPNRVSELWAPLVITRMSDDIIEHIYNVSNPPDRVSLMNPANKSYYTKRLNDQMVFEWYFCDGKSSRFGWEAKGSSNEEELAVLLREHGMIRRRKSEFMTPLPPLRQKFIYCELGEENQKIYQKAQDNFREHLVEKLRKEAKENNWTKTQLRLAVQDKLEKVNNSEAIMKMSELRQLVGTMKIDHTVDWINRYFAGDPLVVGENNNNQKLIVFSHHREAQKRLVEHPDLQQHGVLYIGAGTKNLNDIVDEFQDPNSGKNLLILYSHATDGLTLTAAHAVFVLEIPFVPSTLIQMAGRCWARYSDLYAPHGATLYLSTSNTGIDQYLENMVREKSILAKTVIDGEAIVEELNTIDSEEEEQYDSSSDILRQLIKKNK